MGLVTETTQRGDNLIRKCTIHIIKEGIPKTRVRPVHELVLVPHVVYFIVTYLYKYLEDIICLN